MSDFSIKQLQYQRLRIDGDLANPQLLTANLNNNLGNALDTFTCDEGLRNRSVPRRKHKYEEF